MRHPECGHDRAYTPDDFDIECCICADNPCHLVTVEQMRAHRLYDIALYTTGSLHAAPF